jgi:hypothetical protein
MRSLEHAFEAGSRIHIIRAAVLGAFIHTTKASAASGPGRVEWSFAYYVGFVLAYVGVCGCVSL